MTDSKRTNLRMIMKKAHELAKEINTPDCNYRTTLGMCISIMSKRFKMKKVSSPSLNFKGGRLSSEQLETIKAMKNILGSQYEGVKNSQYLNKIDAGLEIENNMNEYTLQKEMSFATVEQYKVLCMIKHATGKKMETARRDISRKDASNWISKYKYLLERKAV